MHSKPLGLTLEREICDLTDSKSKKSTTITQTTFLVYNCFESVVKEVKKK